MSPAKAQAMTISPTITDTKDAMVVFSINSWQRQDDINAGKVAMCQLSSKLWQSTRSKEFGANF